MGWLWGSSTDGANDPTKKLDDGLRDFLDKESSRHDETKATAARPAAAPSTDAASNTFRAQLGLDTPGLDQKHQNSAPSDRPAVPPEALYQDGRYAHLWKNYRPQSEVESAGKSDQDRLADLVQSFKDRKAEIGRTALENCADYQIAERECLTNGSLWKKMTMCREEGKAFNRCYTMQARFLSALGYLSQVRSEEEEERIQMHADKLYHEMLERERIQKEAEEKGQELPELPPLIVPEKITAALGEDSAFARARKLAMERGMQYNLSSYTPEKQEEFKKRIDGLSPAEKEVELQLIAAESRSQLEYAEQIAKHMQEEKQHREERRDRGKETIGDTLRRLWGT
ncbi:hypothetical protein CB0940_01564 [Cercospora beticola]|uniref:Autophagy protein n=1 Tax=Cercospora beticola TaxID=122368 RepID=A0A2G5IBH3_CERBT|nr:hypothetical protein CB0940_01564 [Cercospora beticola]PIB02100.1 hypothetical protein CB0940_01564 [Cercospora beticola]WPA97005.1 hypothetical protein RHO25_001613 [Cercospora beticola]